MRLLPMCLLVAACGSAKPLVVVSVDSDVPLHSVDSLHVTATIGARSAQFDVRSSGDAAVGDIPPTFTFGIVPPNGLGASMLVVVGARDSDGHAMASGQNQVTLKAGSRTDVAVKLSVSSSQDMAGTSGDLARVDSGVADDLPQPVDLLSPPDLRTITWTAETLPVPNVFFKSVWGTPDGQHIYAVGNVVVAGQPSGVVLYSPGDGSWTDQTPGFTPSPSPKPALVQVWGSATNDVYMTDQRSTSPLWHSSGNGVWTIVPNLNYSTGTFAVWGTDSNNVYVGGIDGHVLHWQGTHWTSETCCPAGHSATSIWGTISVVYAICDDANVYFSTGNATWTPRDVSNTSVTSGALVGGTSATDLYAMGNNASFTSILIHSPDGTNWSTVMLPGTPFAGIWGTDSANVYVAGDSGQLFHFDGSSWTSTQIASGNTLGIWGASGSNIYAVGDSGIFRGR